MPFIIAMFFIIFVFCMWGIIKDVQKTNEGVQRLREARNQSTEKQTEIPFFMEVNNAEEDNLTKEAWIEEEKQLQEAANWAKD